MCRALLTRGLQWDDYFVPWQFIVPSLFNTTLPSFDDKTKTLTQFGRELEKGSLVSAASTGDVVNLVPRLIPCQLHNLHADDSDIATAMLNGMQQITVYLYREPLWQYYEHLVVLGVAVRLLARRLVVSNRDRYWPMDVKEPNAVVKLFSGNDDCRDALLPMCKVLGGQKHEINVDVSDVPAENIIVTHEGLWSPTWTVVNSAEWASGLRADDAVLKPGMVAFSSVANMAAIDACVLLNTSVKTATGDAKRHLLLLQCKSTASEQGGTLDAKTVKDTVESTRSKLAAALRNPEHPFRRARIESQAQVTLCFVSTQKLTDAAKYARIRVCSVAALFELFVHDDARQESTERAVRCA